MAVSMRKHYREPAPKSHPFCASIGTKIYHCSTVGSSREKQLKIDVFDPIRESWKQLDSRGDTHTAEHSGACASITNDLYTFGGIVGESRYDGLHKLDTTTMKWSYVGPRSSVRPSAKTGCRMIPLPRNRLALFGGYTQKVVKKNKSPFQKNTTSGGTCNELHVFNIDRSEWTTPESHGDKPPPCSNFSMSGVDDKRAVMFGGTARGLSRSDELYIIHWDSMLWTKFPKSGPWPRSRKAHAACCLNYGRPNPLILMSGGQDAEGNRLRDLWLLDVNQCRWRQLPDLPRPARSGHVLTAFALSDNLVEVTLFGGSDQKDKKLSHTCILRFESEGGEDDWVLTNYIEPADVGRPIERVQEKMESLGILPSSAHSVSSSVGSSDRPQGQPQSGDDSNEDSTQKLVRQETAFDGEGSLGHLSARSKRNYIIGLEELEFGKQLGEGAYGTVYAGRWKTRGNEEVAIKKCFNKPFDAEILSVLPRHPNVVLFYATSASEDATYIITELVTNGSLYDYIHTQSNTQDYQQSVSWAKQVAYGMEHLHGHHIVHRDLKSGNVLISEDMTMKVCDFGTARAVVDKCEQSTVRGTYRWMAPEIMREDDAVIDKMCDVFSFGCVLYELFERKLPYHSEKNSVFLAMKVLEGLRPELSGENDIPDFLQSLMAACWREEPQERPQFEDCITALRMKAFKE